MDALCTALKTSLCIPPVPTCSTVPVSVSLTAFPGGTIKVNVGYTGPAPDVFEYTIDGGEVVYNKKSNINIFGQAVGTHTISVRGICLKWS